MEYPASTNIGLQASSDAEALAYWLRVGAACDVARDDRRAVEAYRRALDRAPDNVEARLGVADALSRCGRFGAAASLCAQSLRAAPHDGRLYECFARVMERAGLAEQADILLRLACSHLTAQSTSVWYALGQRIKYCWSRDARPGLDKWWQAQAWNARRQSTAPARWPGGQEDDAPFLADLSPGFHIGIAWTDEATPTPALADLLAALAGIPGMRLVNLHRHSGTPAVDGVHWEHPAEEPPVATAHLLQQMNLVLSTDCDTAALSAALGCPTWVFLPVEGRDQPHWMFDTDGAPAFRRTRAIRPSESGQWSPVLQQIRGSLLRMLCKEAPQLQLTWTQQTLLRAAIALADQRHAEAESHYIELLAASDPLTEEVIFALMVYLRLRPSHQLHPWLELRTTVAWPAEHRWLDRLSAA